MSAPAANIPTDTAPYNGARFLADITSCSPMTLIFTALLGFIVLEMVTRRFTDVYTPSVAISFVSTHVQSMFMWIGRQLARTVALLDYINVRRIVEFIRDILWEIVDSTVAVTAPLANIVISPWYIVRGYGEYIMEFVHPWVIIVGTGILGVAIAVFMVYSGWLNYIVAQGMHRPHTSIIIVLVVITCSGYYNLVSKTTFMADFRSVFYGAPVAA
jgi:hypothetical protein